MARPKIKEEEFDDDFNLDDLDDLGDDEPKKKPKAEAKKRGKPAASKKKRKPDPEPEEEDEEEVDLDEDSEEISLDDSDDVAEDNDEEVSLDDGSEDEEEEEDVDEDDLGDPEEEVDITEPDNLTNDAEQAEAKPCSIIMPASELKAFISKIQLGGIIKDCFIEAKDDQLMSAFCDSESSAVYGFVVSDVEDIRESGQIIIPDLKKFAAITKQFSGKIVLKFDNQFISIQTVDKKKKAKLLSFERGHVNSLQNIKPDKINPKKGIIGERNFLKDANFSLNISEVKEMLDAAGALGEAEYTFFVTPSGVKVGVTDQQDRVDLTLNVSELKVDEEITAQFGLIGLGSILKTVSGETVKLFINESFLVLRDGSDNYLFMAHESAE